MLGVTRTPQAIPRSDSLSHPGWLRKGCRAAVLQIDKQYGFGQLGAKMTTPNPQEPLPVDVRAGLKESRWLALTRRFSNVGATITTTPLNLLGRLQFLSRISDKDIQMPVQFQKVVGVVLRFDELNSLLDW